MYVGIVSTTTTGGIACVNQRIEEWITNLRSLDVDGKLVLESRRGGRGDSSILTVI